MSADFDEFASPYHQARSTNQNLTKAQYRYQQIEMLTKKFKGADQYVLSRPDDWSPTRVVSVSALQAAEMISDRKARLATKEEIAEHDAAHAKAKKYWDAQVNKKTLSQVLKDAVIQE
jgi:hypothetical protein